MYKRVRTSGLLRSIRAPMPRVTPKYVRERSHQVPHTCTPQLEPDGVSIQATTLKRPYATLRTVIVFTLGRHASPKYVREKLRV